ncbi:hypothetical protein A9Q88_10975 [Gammaproteobacteria bacterium 50_400_T64]|nr:hypothetical protein A9Q88_10975 [Gammaproteobacteria bacterium 50_400_T64]
MKDNTTNISAIGLNLRSIKTFEFFFKKTCKGRYVLCESHNDANITLVDIDVPGSNNALKEQQLINPKNKFVCLSIADNNKLNLPHIKKPINSASLIAILDSFAKVEPSKESKDIVADNTNKTNDLIARENSRQFNKNRSALAGRHIGANDDTGFFGDNEDISTKNSKDITKVTYHPKKMFQGAVIEGYHIAKQNNCAIQVTALGISIIIDPSNSKVYTTTPERIFRPICLLETNNKAQFKHLGVEHLKDKVSHFQSNKDTDDNCSDIDTFLWKITLWSSRGRIPEDTDLSVPVYLAHWPNLTRLDNIPHAPRIAALLISAPDTLCHVAEKLQIPQRYVFGFYSAAHTLNLSSNARRQVDSLFKPVDKPVSQSRSILRKIFKHITRKSQADNSIQKQNNAQ